MKLADLIAKFEAIRANLSQEEAEALYAELAEKLDQHQDSTSCPLCFGSGLHTVEIINMDHARGAPIRTGRMRTIPCPRKCNLEAVERTIAASQRAIQADTDRIFQEARNPPMPKGM